MCIYIYIYTHIHICLVQSNVGAPGLVPAPGQGIHLHLRAPEDGMPHPKRTHRPIRHIGAIQPSTNRFRATFL